MAEYHVSLLGDDSNPGSLDAPFGSIGRAQTATREGDKPGPHTVYVHEGTHYLHESLSFDYRDSGAHDAPVSYRPHKSDRVTLSGGLPLDCKWEPYRDGISRCSLPVSAPGDFTQLFVNSKRMTRARYPNYCADDHLVHGAGYTDTIERVPEESGRIGFTYDPTKFTDKQWAHPEKAVLHISHNWGFLQFRVEDVDRENRAVYVGEGGWQINFVGPSGEVGMPDFGSRAEWVFGDRRFFIENVFEELDAPGEWYLNDDSRTLYFYPPEGLDLSTALVEVPVLESVAAFKGTQASPVRHVSLSGFRIAHTRSTFLDEYEAPSLGDWTIHRGGAVLIEGTEQCGVENCFFDAVGGNAVFVGNYNAGVRVKGCVVTEAGESAVCVVGSRHKVYGSNKAYPSDTLVENNYIRDIGAFGKQVAGVFVSIARGVTIRRNLMHSLPRAGICLNDCWAGGHIIEHNEIYDTVRETRDHGPFNSWGREGYWCENQSHHYGGVPYPHPAFIRRLPEETVIRNNYFHGIEGYVMGDYRQAIDMDDGSLNFHVYNNLCVDIAISIREGDYRTVENNIIINPVVPMGMHVLFDENHDVVRKNIIVTRADLYHLNDAPPTTPWLSVNDNLFFNADEPWGYRPSITVRPRGEALTKYTLDQWKDLGYDANSQYADPLFVDPDNGDYRVAKGSPALELGFENFEMDFGPDSGLPRFWMTDDDIAIVEGRRSDVRSVCTNARFAE